MNKLNAVLLVLVGVLVAMVVNPSLAVAAPGLVSSAGGRFQVVNPMPELARMVMLVDSATGSTWVLCTLGDAKDTGWCVMPKSRGTAGGAE